MNLHDEKLMNSVIDSEWAFLKNTLEFYKLPLHKRIKIKVMGWVRKLFTFA